MGKDEYYARVQALTEEALEALSVLTPGVSELVLQSWQAMQQAAAGELDDTERNSLTNLSFFYFLGTCIDFLFFLHLRHRDVNVYQHELEHILSVLITHAKTQREEFARGLAHEALEGHAPGAGHAPASPFNLVEFTKAVRRLSEQAGDGDVR